MAYSASVPAGHRRAAYNKYRRSGPSVFLKKMFQGLFRLVGFSFLLAGSLGFILFISIALVYGYNRAVNSSFFSLKEIEIIGNRQLTYAHLTELMEVNPGDNLLQLKMHDIHARLNSNPWVDEVSVKRIFPDRILVNIREKQAYFWIQNQDRIYYSDDQGRVITAISPGRYVSLPLLYLEGEPRDHDLPQLVSFLEDRSFPFSLQDISWIRAQSSGTIEVRINTLGLNIVLDREILDMGPGRLSMVWSDLYSRGETDLVQKIIVAGSNAWIGYKEQ